MFEFLALISVAVAAVAIFDPIEISAKLLACLALGLPIALGWFAGGPIGTTVIAAGVVLILLVGAWFVVGRLHVFAKARWNGWRAHMASRRALAQLANEQTGNPRLARRTKTRLRPPSNQRLTAGRGCRLVARSHRRHAAL